MIKDKKEDEEVLVKVEAKHFHRIAELIEIADKKGWDYLFDDKIKQEEIAPLMTNLIECIDKTLFLSFHLHCRKVFPANIITFILYFMMGAIVDNDYDELRKVSEFIEGLKFSQFKETQTMH